MQNTVKFIRYFLISLLASGFFIVSFSSVTFASDIPRDWLIWEWLLNGNALDTSGNGNNGVANNVTWVPTNVWNQSQAASFNGSNSSVSRPALPIANNWTVMQWMNKRTNSVWLSFSNYNAYMYLSPSWIAWASYYDWSDRWLVSNTAITDNNMHFVVWTKSSTEWQKIYVDWVLSWTEGSTSSTITGYSWMGIWYFAAFNSNFTDQIIQSTRVYNRVLSSSEIQAIYQNESIPQGPSCHDGIKNQNETSVDLWGICWNIPRTGLVAEYLFNDNANDTSWYGNNGYPSGNIQYIPGVGENWKALMLDGNSYVTIGKTPSLVSAMEDASFSYCMWVKPASFDTTSWWAIVFWDDDTQWGGDRWIYYNDGRVGFTGYEDPANVGNVWAPLNTFTHICFAADNTQGVKFYANGNLVDSRTRTVWSHSTRTFVTIGAWHYGYTWWGVGEAFKWAIANLRVYNRPITPEEVQALYNEWNETVAPPTKPSQKIQSPELAPQDINPWEKIWKFQSGSGVILSANIDNTSWKELKLDFEVYKMWSIFPSYSKSTEYFNSWIWTITIPYSALWAGDYYWKVRTSDGLKTSDWASFWTDSSYETDYGLYEWFEPYPYGYKFANSSPEDWLLTWWIEKIYHFFPYYVERKKVDWSKWDIFNSVFPLSVFWGNERKQIDWFESIWLNEKNPKIFYWWNCFWLSFSALNKYYEPQMLQSEFPDFYNLMGVYWTIWENIKSPIIWSWFKWNDYNTTFKTILAYQLYQRWDKYLKLEESSQKNQTPNDILNYLKNNSKNPYLLTISWRTCYINSICPTQYHTVVPYKIEWNKIYIWDNNVQYPQNNYWKAYEQYIEINNDGTWKNPYYSGPKYWWDYFEKISLVNIYDVYSLGNLDLIWFKWNDYVISLSWNSDISFEDNQWRISWFSWWTILEEIPWIIVVKPLNVSENWYVQENTWKQIYLPEKIGWLTIKVSWKTDEKYNLMIAGWDYYTKLENIETNTWQVDAFKISREQVQINFDDNKVWTYNLLIDDFQNNWTWSVYKSDLTSTNNLEQFNIDWPKVVNNESNAIKYNMDIDNDWIFDMESYFSAIPKSENEKWSISWYVKWDTNASMAGWKICIDTNKNGTCEESKEPFRITDNKWYYKFDNLEKWNYSIIEIPHQNWSTKKQKYYAIVNNWQNIVNLNFENNFIKWKGK